ncbi:MAG: UDP-3-O-acyl-N-acetylglucosamine deacetylase [Planctomycetota bacterium]|nr:UDP-3-O-acyl-N-acetylglucosamine deacetylase [Planctomycetota bacterium]
MQSHRLQQTLAGSFHVTGYGYWSGIPVTVTLNPAAANTGICFRRSDLLGRPSIQATAEHRHETQLRTRLTSSECSFDMIEHIMSALHAAQVDNCIVDCSAQEMPGLDGSSLRFALGIDQAGVVSQSAAVADVKITTPIRIGTDEQWIMALPHIDQDLDSGLTCEYRLDFGPHSVIPKGDYCIAVNHTAYMQEVAPARTFITHHEAEILQSQGIAKHVTHRDLLVFGSQGPVGNTLRFADECARHKLLDLIGDLALSGVQIHGRVIACRSGHVLNGRMALELRKLAFSNALAGENYQLAKVA